MGKIIYFNGTYRDESEKLLSVQERATNFGDGLFEVMLCVGGRFLSFRKHLGRMATAAAEMAIPFPFDADALLDAARALSAKNGIVDGELYVQLTRGEAPRYHLFPKDTPPNFFMILNPLRPIPASARETGVDVCLMPDKRHGYCGWKTLNLLPNVLGKEEAKRKGVYEACFFREDADGRAYVTEGASSSFFSIKNGVITTPDLDNILPGATRAAIIELANGLGMTVRESRLPVDDLRDGDEAFLVSTVSRVMPVVAVEDRTVGDGKVGPITKRLQMAYAEFLQAHLE